jgi:hypothetical protein
MSTNGYRLLRVCSTGPYGELFSAFLERYHGASFEETMQRCREHGFLYPGSLKRHLETHGAEVMEILVDAPPAQAKWLQENGFDPDLAEDKEEAFFRQLAAYKPDVVYFQTFSALGPEARRCIKQRCPSVRLVVGHRGFPLMDCTGYEDVDAVFLGYPSFHDRWHAVGVETFFHLHCFDEDLLPLIGRRAAELEPIDFSFIGTTGWGFPPHDGRYYDLRKVLDATRLVVFGNEPAASTSRVDSLPVGARMALRSAFLGVARHSPEVAIKVLYKAGQLGNAPLLMRAADAAMRNKRYGPDPKPPLPQNLWYLREKPIRELYPDRIHPPRFGIEYFALLASSRVTWNRHLEMDGAGANMRLFEACGVGACQLTDYRDEVVQAFAPDTEVVVYRSIYECIEKARWLLDHPAERQTIGLAGQARALRDHNVGRRAEQVHAHFGELLRDARGKGAPRSPIAQTR